MHGIVAHSPANINFNLTPTEEGLSPKRLGLLTFLSPFTSFIEIILFAKNFPEGGWYQIKNRTQIYCYLCVSFLKLGFVQVIVRNVFGAKLLHQHTMFNNS